MSVRPFNTDKMRRANEARQNERVSGEVRVNLAIDVGPFLRQIEQMQANLAAVTFTKWLTKHYVSPPAPAPPQ